VAEKGADARVRVKRRFDEVAERADGALEFVHAGRKQRALTAVNSRIDLLQEVPDAERPGAAEEGRERREVVDEESCAEALGFVGV